MNTDEVRAKFEKWLEGNNFSKMDMTKFKADGEYIVPSVQLGWLGYQQGIKDSAEWISVADRLPEGRVLVACNGGNMIGVGKYKSSEGWSLYTGVGTITHWMPLPEPPALKEAN